MSRTKKFIDSLLCASVFSALVLTGCTAEGSDNNNNKRAGYSNINIYEETDEKQMYTDHGFSRGDLEFLYTANFDPAKVQTIQGKVSKVVRVQYPDQDCYLIAVVKSQGENEMAVNLGPVWFADENNLVVDEGDTIQVTGSKLRTNGRFVVLATEVSANGHTLNVRDKQGKSLWGAPKSQRGDADCMIKYKK